jgi:predicted Ser/Thr protein kinase
MVGEVLADRYELEELVGTGGMSSVFRAHDRLLDRKVALKILHQQYSGDDDYVERFRREARSVAALSHPNIVTVIDRGEHADRQFIVFEYVAGENLKRLIERRGPSPVPAALELGIQIARGLSFAHQQGLIHRDVKPQNVLLNGDGRAKVTDFGIARSLDVQHGMTQTGTVLGTSDYIAPEQAQGQRVDEHTDIYSLGIVMYELLTSEVPFPGENFVAVAMRHINEEPPLVGDKRPDVPARVEAAIQKAMAKRPEDRFPTMEAFCLELEACLAELQSAGTQVARPAARRPRPQHRRHRPRISPWPLLGALAVLALAATIAAVILLHGNGGGPGGGGGISGSVQVRAVKAYDPYGGDGEHDAEAGRATDGNAGTYWPTESYRTAPGLGKPGVGLVLDTGAPKQLHRLGFSTSTPGLTAEILAGDSPNGPFDAVVGTSQTAGSDGRVEYTIAVGAHRYYVIWITRLGAGYRNAHINEVRAD